MKNSNTSVQRFFCDIVLSFAKRQELELVEDAWRGEIQDMRTQISHLQSENQRLRASLSIKDEPSTERETNEEGMLHSACILYDGLQCHSWDIECMLVRLTLREACSNRTEAKSFKVGRPVTNHSSALFDWCSPSYIQVQFTVYITFKMIE